MSNLKGGYKEQYRELRMISVDAFHAAVEAASVIGINHHLDVSITAEIEQAMVNLLLTFADLNKGVR